MLRGDDKNPAWVERACRDTHDFTGRASLNGQVYYVKDTKRMVVDG